MKWRKRIYPFLGPKSIQHLLKCFTYAVKSNNDTSVLKKILEIVPPHVFWDHKECHMKWCTYLQDPENYKPKHLSYGQYLTGEDFRNDLQHFFSDLAKNATKLCNLGSTQANEILTELWSVKIQNCVLWWIREHILSYGSCCCPQEYWKSDHWKSESL